jgi:hypothetical protein
VNACFYGVRSKPGGHALAIIEQAAGGQQAFALGGEPCQFGGDIVLLAHQIEKVVDFAFDQHLLFALEQGDKALRCGDLAVDGLRELGTSAAR